MEDGLYIKLVAVKDGTEYTAKIVSMKEVTLTLTNSLMDGIEKLWEEK